MMEPCFPSLHAHAHTDHWHAPIPAVDDVHTPCPLMMFITDDVHHWFPAERKVFPECLNDAVDMDMPYAHLQSATPVSQYLEG